jgi:hypothetical protein
MISDPGPCGCLALPAVIGFLTLIAVLIGAAAAWDLYDA